MGSRILNTWLVTFHGHPWEVLQGLQMSQDDDDNDEDNDDDDDNNITETFTEYWTHIMHIIYIISC